MKNKIIILVTIGLFAILILVWVFWNYKGSDTEQTNSNSQQILIEVTGKDGQKVAINDFQSGALKTSEGFIPYYDSDYTILFEQSQQKFEITFTMPSLEQILQKRPIIEEKLLSLLGVSKDEACKLNVIEVIPKTAAFDLDPNEFSLSFCSSNDDFPTSSNIQPINIR